MATSLTSSARGATRCETLTRDERSGRQPFPSGQMAPADQPELLDLLGEYLDLEPDELAALLEEVHVPWPLDRRTLKWRAFERVPDPLGWLS